jgi:hypothetical protein
MQMKFGVDKYANVVLRRGYTAQSGNRVHEQKYNFNKERLANP